jgi:acetyl esterase/lipase
MTTLPRLIIFLLGALIYCSAAIALDSEHTVNIIQLWPEHAEINGSTNEETIVPDPRGKYLLVTNINIPSMQYFPAAETGQHTPAIILCPGGAYKYLVVSKMTAIAEWLNENGISAFVLKYRAPQMREEALQDLQRAIRIVRSQASEWNIDPQRIGVLGTSAGGHLAARASAGLNLRTYKAVDKIDCISSRPDFTVLLYPAYMNKGNMLKQEFSVSSELAPTLIISAKDDKKYFSGSPVYAKALKDAGASVRVFPHGQTFA